MKFKALLLLFIYCMGNLPSVMNHHHSSEVAYNHASACEKEIYYGVNTGGCTHQFHYSNALDRCILCDHYNLAPCTLFEAIPALIKLETIDKYNIPAVQFRLTVTAVFASRGPPAWS